MRFEYFIHSPPHRCRVKGYMTVEASVIIPITIGITVLSILLSFFLYNHCVCYQELYISALRGQQLRWEDNNTVKRKIDDSLSELLDHQVYEYVSSAEASVSLLKIDIKCDVNVSNRVGALSLYDNSFIGERAVSIVRFDPVGVIRMKNID